MNCRVEYFFLICFSCFCVVKYRCSIQPDKGYNLFSCWVLQSLNRPVSEPKESITARDITKARGP